jgi:hypothetical protein
MRQISSIDQGGGKRRGGEFTFTDETLTRSACEFQAIANLLILLEATPGIEPG